MAKNIVVFIDGTSNAGRKGSRTNTNVFKLFIAADAANGNLQRCLYIKGVGTWGGFTRVAGGTTGLGVARRIRLAYQFMAGNYEDGDRIYLFGFSRGAFAARSLAGFVEHVGLLLRPHPASVRRAFRIYQRDQSVEKSELRYFVRSVNRHYDGRERSPLPVYFIGVWDTVGRLGVPGVNGLLPDRWIRFHKTDLPSNVTHARQALALHELRQIFDPEIWTSYTPPQTLKQTWFAGAHSDVGGGYEDHGLSDIALCWMAAEAKKVGLRIDETLLESEAQYLAPVHHAISGPFRFVKPVCRSMLADHPKPLETVFVHQSVASRYLSKHPPQHPGRNQVRNALVSVDTAAQRFMLRLTCEVGNRPTACEFVVPDHGLPIRACCVVSGDWWDDIGTSDVSEAADVVRSALEDGNIVPESVSLSRALAILFLLGQHTRLDRGFEAFRSSRTQALNAVSNLQTKEEIQEVENSIVKRLKWVQSQIDATEASLPPAARGEFRELAAKFGGDGVTTLVARLHQQRLRLLAADRPVHLKRT
jgi:uncharacterized protein (DUF2235 family)